MYVKINVTITKYLVIFTYTLTKCIKIESTQKSFQRNLNIANRLSSRIENSYNIYNPEKVCKGSFYRNCTSLSNWPKLKHVYPHTFIVRCFCVGSCGSSMSIYFAVHWCVTSARPIDWSLHWMTLSFQPFSPRSIFYYTCVHILIQI